MHKILFSWEEAAKSALKQKIEDAHAKCNMGLNECVNVTFRLDHPDWFRDGSGTNKNFTVMDKKITEDHNKRIEIAKRRREKLVRE